MRSARICKGPVLLGLVIGTLSPAAALAQFMDLSGIVQQNMAFDQAVNSQLGAMQANLAAQQQQLLQSYVQTMGPKLVQDYQQFMATTGMQIPFEQYAYYHMATAGGTNPGPALAQQQRNFQALQEANRTQQQGFESYRQGMEQNSQTMDRIADAYANQAIRGNAQYVNPYTNEMSNLPYTSGPGYYTGGGNTYYQSPTGQYYQVYPDGYRQPLTQVNPLDE
jgi:hypothetical protein